MKSTELQTTIYSHADSLILSLIHPVHGFLIVLVHSH